MLYWVNIFILGVAILFEITMSGCRKKEAPFSLEKDMASLEMLSDSDRARLQRVTSNPQGAREAVRELLASPDVFVRMMTLSRLENWPQDDYMPFVLAASESDASSMVRARALRLAWKGMPRALRGEPHYRELVDATVARLSDADDEVFSLACEKLDSLDDTGYLSELPRIIDEAPERRISRLFSLFCKKDLSREDVDFVLAHDTQLGAAKTACREQVARARRLKFMYE